MREAFQHWRPELERFAAEFADQTSFALVVEESVDSFAANAEALDPTPEESANGIRFRRQIELAAGVFDAPQLTYDGLALLLCHELGHHYGGYPFTKSDQLTTAEGESDYFATRVCAPRLFRAPSSLPPSQPSEPSSVYAQCATSSDAPLCERLLFASLSLIRAVRAHPSGEDTAPPYAATAGEPVLGCEDPFRVERTVGGYYPSAQCRLDTLVRGTLCGIELATGPYTPSTTEVEALGSSCSSASLPFGARPGCWFREGSAPTTFRDTLDVVWQPLR